MKTILEIDSQTYILENQLSREQTIISIGRQSDEAYNAIPIQDESVDLFQCQIVKTETGWKIQNGQWRTECPKGIRSRLQHACSICIGRCVNLRPAHPNYSWRTPQRPTLLNGKEITTEGSLLCNDDIITIGRTTIHVSTLS